VESGVTESTVWSSSVVDSSPGPVVKLSFAPVSGRIVDSTCGGSFVKFSPALCDSVDDSSSFSDSVEDSLSGSSVEDGTDSSLEVVRPSGIEVVDSDDEDVVTSESVGIVENS